MEGKPKPTWGAPRTRKALAASQQVTRKLSSDKEEGWQQPEHEAQAAWNGGMGSAIKCSQKHWVVLSGRMPEVRRWGGHRQSPAFSDASEREDRVRQRWL